MGRTSGQSPWQSCPAFTLHQAVIRWKPCCSRAGIDWHRQKRSPRCAGISPRPSRRRLPALANELSVVPWLKPRHHPLAAPWRASREGAA